MLYSRYAKKNPKVLKIQEAQRKEIELARKAKESARSHEEKLLIQARTRSNLDKIAKGEKVSGEKEAPKAPEAKMIDLGKKKEVSAAIKKIVKEIESGS